MRHEMRTFDIESVPTDSITEAWSGVNPDKKVTSCVACNFGFGEETIGFLCYADETFEVGIGEPLHQYKNIYKGTDPNEASKHFIAAILYAAMQPKSQKDLESKIRTLIESTVAVRH